MNPEQQPSKIEKLYIPLAILIAGIIIGAGLFLGGRSTPRNITAASGTPNTAIRATNVRPISADDHMLGNPNADVVIIEYSDTECPFCKSFYVSLQQVLF